VPYLEGLTDYRVAGTVHQGSADDCLPIRKKCHL